MKFGDLLMFEDVFTPLKPFNHPTYGEILIGGWNKYSSRVPPLFMLEELCHRNFAFTMYHADQMPRLSFSRMGFKRLDAGLWQVTVEVKNDAAIPTISGLAVQKKIGARDQITLRPPAGGDATVLASGTVESWYDRSMALTKRQPERIWVDTGIGRHTQRLFRWIVEGTGPVDIRYTSQKGGTIIRTVELAEPSPGEP